MKQAAQCAIVLEKERKRVTSFEAFLKQDAGMLSRAASCEVGRSDVAFFAGNYLKHSSLNNYLFPTPPQHTWCTRITVVVRLRLNKEHFVFEVQKKTTGLGNRSHSAVWD